MAEQTLWDGKTLRDWAPIVVDEIVKFCNPRKIILFGSVARGQEGPDSDLDLMVILDHIDPKQRHQLMSSIRWAAPHEVPMDIFVTDVEEFERRKDIRGSMQYWPAHEGDVVYERAA